MIVVTGGGSGIGKALTHALAKVGQRVLIVGRREENLIEVKKTYSDKIDYCVADLGRDVGREKLLDNLISEPSISALIHNAGLLAPLKPLRDILKEEWQTSLAINLEAPLFLTSALLPKLKGGKVLHLSSAAAHDAYPHWGAYCTSKSALYMLYELFKKEEPQVSFGSVMPGITDTAMQSMIRETSSLPEDHLDFFQQLKVKGKLLSPNMVAQFLSWLLLEVDKKTYSEKEWDIYDESHHPFWLKDGVMPKVFDNE